MVRGMVRVEEGQVLGSAAEDAGLQAMPVRDQMELQLTLVFAGVELVTADRAS